MNFRQVPKRVCTLATLLLLFWAGGAQAVVFQLVYDSVPDATINPAHVVGTGTFSYDGPATAGEFLLSALTGVSYSSTLTGSAGTASFSAPPFDPLDSSLIGISVVAIGGGDFELVFTGSSAGTTGSLDVITATGLLSHEPVAPAGSPATGIALYGANDSVAQLQLFGDYLATTAGSAVPEPGTLALMALALAGFRYTQRKAA